MFDWEVDDEEDEGDVGFDKKEFGGKNVLLFLVDGTENMHRTLKTGQTLFQTALEAANATMKSKILSSGKDLIGVVCFGTTNKKPTTIDFDHISELASLREACKDNILALEELTHPDTGKQTFLDQFGDQGQVRLAEVLWHCQSLIANIKGKVASKRILLLTANQDPHSGDQVLNLKARRKAADLHASSTYLEVIPVLHPDDDGFNKDVFYTDIVKLAMDDWSGQQAYSVEDLTELVIKKTFVKRTTSRLKFNIGGVEVGVATYNLLGRATKPTKKRLALDNNEEVRSERAYLHPTSKEPLLSTDIVRFMNYGGKDIKMAEDEVNFIKSFGEESNSLKLLGFRPADFLKLGQHVKLPQFLYPCEQLVKGSKTLLHSLIVRCKQRDKVAICSFKQRSSSGPNYVALVPQMEETENGIQTKPPGFHVIYLPYLDDIRKLPESRLNQDNPREGVDAAKAVIGRLKLTRFIPVENGAVQSTYRMVEAHALERETVEKVEDETLPDLERMARKLGERSETFINQVYEQGYDPAGPVRKAAASKPKEPKAPTQVDHIDMEQQVQSGTVKKLTVDVLKSWLRTKGVSVTGKKKADLVDAVIAQF